MTSALVLSISATSMIAANTLTAVLGTLATLAVIVLVVSLLYRRHDRSAYGMRVAFWKMSITLFCLVCYRLRRIGNETIPATGPVIIVSNHTCSIDPLLLVSVCPRRYISFIIAEEYAIKPVFRRLVQMIECIPVKRDGFDAPAARAAMRHLRDGKVLGIFPEGRIVRPDEPPVEPKEGMAVLALRTGATVIPVHIAGTYYSDSVITPLFLPHRARLTIGPPVDLSPYQSNKKDRDNIAAAAAKIMRSIRELEPPSDNES